MVRRMAVFLFTIFLKRGFISVLYFTLPLISLRLLKTILQLRTVTTMKMITVKIIIADVMNNEGVEGSFTAKARFATRDKQTLCSDFRFALV
jgi:hypothetical protein